MRKKLHYLVLIVITIFCSLITVNAQLGIGTNTPDSSAVVDIFSNNKGMLVPRIALTAANLPAPVAGPAIGLFIYNTATSGTAPNKVVPGFYYWNGERWYPVVNKGVSAGDMQYWDGAKWIMIPGGSQGQNLTWCNGRPVWGPCAATVATIAPVNNPYEGHTSQFSPTGWGGPSDQLPILTWTVFGTPGSARVMLKFDYSSIPAGAVIDSARLYLYADLTPINGNTIDAHFGSANAFLIQRITSTWNTPTAFTWNTPPTVTTSNQVIVPQSTSSFQNMVADVTQLVRDQVTSGNNGFNMQLVVENYYNSRQYCSSKEADATRHPKILIYYH